MLVAVYQDEVHLEATRKDEEVSALSPVPVFAHKLGVLAWCDIDVHRVAINVHVHVLCVFEDPLLMRVVDFIAFNGIQQEVSTLVLDIQVKVLIVVDDLGSTPENGV